MPRKQEARSKIANALRMRSNFRQMVNTPGSQQPSEMVLVRFLTISFLRIFFGGGRSWTYVLFPRGQGLRLIYVGQCVCTNLRSWESASVSFFSDLLFCGRRVEILLPVLISKFEFGVTSCLKYFSDRIAFGQTPRVTKTGCSVVEKKGLLTIGC